MKQLNYILYTVAIFISQLLAQGCTDDDSPFRLPETSTKGQAVFTLNLPKNNGTDTRAMDADQENAITQMAILAFVTNSGNEQLASIFDVAPSDIIRDGTDKKKYSITVSIESGTYSSILLLANSAGILSDHTSLLTTGANKSAIQQQLIAELTDGTKWNASTTSPQPIPMYGEVSGGSSGIIIGSGPSPFSGVSMTRLTARINFLNNETDFTLQHIHLYNFRRDAQVIPTLTPPTLPASARRHTAPLEYGPDPNEIYVFEQDPSDGEEESEMPFIVIGGNYKESGTTWYRIDFVNREDDADDPFIPLIRNRAYNFTIDEVNGPGYGTAADAALCLPFNTATRIFVFDDGGIENILFDGEYYLAISHEKIELDKNEQTHTIHIETDNPLKWKIEQQGGTGWLSIDRTAPAATDDGNVDVHVDPYNNADQPRTAALHISAGRLEYTLPVEQTYLDGISLEIINDDGEPINEVFFRSNPNGYTLSINPRFTVKWKGPECRINVGMLGNRLVTLPAGLANGTILNTSQQNIEYTISPTAFNEADIDPVTGNPFLEEGAAVTFIVTNGIETESRTIYVRHECISLVFDDLETFCYMGHEYDFGVRANTKWRIAEVTTEIDGLFSTTNGQDFKTVQNTTGGDDKTTGSRFTFRTETPTYQSASINYGIGKAGRKMKVTFIDEAGVSPSITKTFTAITQDANSHRVRNGGGNYLGGTLPGSNGRIILPIRKLFWAWEKDVGTELNPAVSGPLNLTAEIIWQTHDGLIQTGNALELSDYGNQNDYRDYCLALWSDNRPNNIDRLGNALIAIKNGTEILWSFHIWVTNYFPDNTPAMGKTFTNTGSAQTPSPVFMDYNLGATLSYTQFDPHGGGTPPAVSPAICGLYYQFGRKDPFPGPREIANPGTYRLDNPNLQDEVVAPGNTPVLVTYQLVTEENNLATSIKNPTIQYMSNSSVSDWFTNLLVRSDQNDYLWIDQNNLKGLYDPCPPGWKIPMRAEYTGFENSHSFETGLGTWATLTPTNRLYMPASGYIRRNSGEGYPEIYIYKSYSYFWCSQISAQYGLTLSGYDARISSDSRISRSNASPVRCIQDTYDWNAQHY